MVYLALAVLIASLAGLRAQHCHYLHVSSLLVKKDNAKLSAELESKLAEMGELKKKMEHLLIKQGLMKG